MSASANPLSNVWARIYQIGVVVRDLDQAKAFYERLGIGPFTDGPSASAVRREIYGEELAGIEVRGLITQMGKIEFELLQPAAGQSIQQEHLDTRGEGVIHLCAYTDDLQFDITAMAELGYPVISYGELDDGGLFAYFDTRATGGVILELFQTGSEHR
jgi:catechol 2,3-dioxygenase-like lactoylglutathione lyase family enzyme